MLFMRERLHAEVGGFLGFCLQGITAREPEDVGRDKGPNC